MKLDAGDRLLDRKEVEQYFGIPKRYLELAATRGNAPRIVRVGRLVRYRVSDVRLWIEANASAEG